MHEKRNVPTADAADTSVFRGKKEREKKTHQCCILFSPPSLDYPLLNLSLLFVCMCVRVCVIFVVKKGKAAPSLMGESGPLPANRELYTFS